MCEESKQDFVLKINTMLLTLWSYINLYYVITAMVNTDLLLTAVILGWTRCQVLGVVQRSCFIKQEVDP